MTVTPEILRGLHRTMLRIRKAELKIESLYHEDEMKTPIHLCIGQEAIAAGVCAALRREDPILTTYRSHGQYLAKGGDLNRMIAELYCRETGCSKGRGGSMHLVDLDAGHYGSSAIVGGCLPIAVGMALSAKMRGESNVTAVFFGDGAADQGIFYESVNFAMLKQLPIVFVLEDNEWAVCSHTSARKAGPCVFRSAAPEDLRYTVLDGNDAAAVFEAAESSVAYCRAGYGPAFLECKTYRVRGHAGSGSDSHLGYRSPEDIAGWEARCPVATIERRLLAEDLLSEGDLIALHEELDRELEDAFDFAQASPVPQPESLYDYVYRG